MLLTVIASGFAFSMRSEALAARNAHVARAGARGGRRRGRAHGVRAVAAAHRPRRGRPTASCTRGRTATSTIVVTAVDEAAKIDLNSRHEALLQGPARATSAGSTPTPPRASSTRSWTGAIPTTCGARTAPRTADYRAAGLKYKPANAPFETVGELARVLGVTPALYARIADSLTVYSRQPGINPLTASRDVLLALPNATPQIVDAYIAAARRRASSSEAAGAAVSRRRRLRAPAPCRSGASAPRRPRPMV